ncbi:hypothetical protein LUZ60_015476 [Juncus effusus]|nr:hypothetical protein LUZ60_015476 [Juncus effusus]
MAIISIAQTAIVGLLLTFVIKPARRLVHYKRRTVKWHDSGSMLRIITCVHHPRDVQALISLVDSTCPSKRTPISVSVMQLVELTSRTSAVLLLNNGLLSNSNFNIPLHAQFASVSRAFESYEQDAEGVFTQLSTALSPFDTMHEDVIVAASDHHAALVLLPFHMHQAVDGALELTSHPSVRIVNERVLHASPCTVAIIIDRGLGDLSHCASILRVVVLFFGGRDDCESLALAGRMANHPAVELLVMQFLRKDSDTNDNLRDEKEIREQCVDEEYLHELRERSGQAFTIDYRKIIVANAEELVEAIRMIEEEKKGLFIVGKGQGVAGSKLTTGMTEWSEFRELGPIGDLLVSDDFGSTSSVLVIQAPLTTSGFAESVGVAKRGS